MHTWPTLYLHFLEYANFLIGHVIIASVGRSSAE